MGGGGGGGGKGAHDNSAKIYAQQQAELARQKAEQDAADKAAADAEQKRRDQLRQQMLGQRDVLASDEDKTVVQNNQLG